MARFVRRPTKTVLVFLVLALASAVGLALQVRQGEQSLHWTVTTGEMVDANVRSETGDDRRTSFYPVLRYAYSVNDRQYEGSQIGLREVGWENVDEAYEVLARYPIGAEVTVYVDPDTIGLEGESPSAVLEPGLQRTAAVVLGGLCLVLLVIAALGHMLDGEPTQPETA